MATYKKSFLSRLTGLSEDELEEFTPVPTPLSSSLPQEEWISSPKEEGELAMDISQTDKDIIIRTPVAGVKSEDIDISIAHDMVTIKGERKIPQTISTEDWIVKECFWGTFSRSIILPVEIKNDQVKAIIKNGILTITLPKAKREKTRLIKVKEEKNH